MLIRFPSVLRDAAAEGDGGSSAAPAAPAPASTDADSSSKLPVPHKSKFAEKNERNKRSAGELKNWLAEQKSAKPAPEKSADKPAAASAEASKPATSEAVETASEVIAEEGGKVPGQRKGETDKQYEARIVEYAQKLRDAEGLTLKEREAREAAEKRATDFEKEINDAKRKLARIKDPATLLEAFEELTGYDYEKLTKGIVDGVVKPKGQAVHLPPEVQERMDRIEAENKRLADIEAQREQEDMTRQQQAVFQSHVAQATTYLADHSDEYPISSVLPWAARHIVNQAYARKTKDVSAPARDLEKSISADFLSVLKNEKSRNALIKSDPELAKALGIGQKPAVEEPAAKKETAKSPSKLPTEVTPPRTTKGLKGKERNRAAAMNLAEWLRDNRSKKAG